MSILLGCIADDFTGATDLAGLLARSGAPVCLRIGVPDDAEQAVAPFEVIALKIRTEPVGDAVKQAKSALAWLQHAGTKQVYWKYCSTFDSTAEGNIGPVSEALMRALGASQTIYAPAFPENGRSVYMGHLFVGSELLSDSPMKDHPLTPMHDSNLIRLLASQVEGKVGQIKHDIIAQGIEAIQSELAALHSQSVPHVVMDAIAQTDLDLIAASCRDMALITGGSALALSIPALMAKAGLWDQTETRPTALSIPERSIVLSGSSSAMSNAQVQHYLATGAPAYQLDPLKLAADGVAPVLRWIEAQDLAQAPLVYATADAASVRAAQEKLGAAEAGRLVEQALAQSAITARNQGARRIIVAGGETSGAVTQALGVNRLEIGREIAPGVPWTYCSSEGVNLALALKSGNFGDESFFTTAQTRLDAA